MKVSTIAFSIVAGLGIIGAGSVRAADVEPIYAKQCASCHGKDGSGNTKAGKLAGTKDFRDAKVQAEIKDETAVKAIKEGIKEKGSDRFRMKPAQGLTDDDIKGLIAYVRKFKG